MLASILVSIFLTLAIFIGLFYFLKNPFLNFLNLFIEKIINTSLDKVESKSKEILKSERDNFVGIAKQDLDSKKDSISSIVNEMRKDLKEAKEKIDQEGKERFKEFENLKSIVEHHKNTAENLNVSVNDLKNILSNNQLRGSFGQEVAEDLLKMAGFVIGQNYIKQTQQETNKSIPDFTVILPDNTKGNIDVKFPFQALQKYHATDDKSARKQYMDEFKLDIKKKIKEVTTRDYINPQENTVDFVILFIPNEMIFSFVYENFNDVWKDAVSNKVVLCGPFSFTAIIRMIKQAFDNFKYQKNLHEIINHIKDFENEFDKFSGAVKTLGDRINSASNQFEVVSKTRSNQLVKIVNRIKSDEILIEEKPSLKLIGSEVDSDK